MKLIRQGRRRWVYILPVIHLCACLTSLIGYAVPSLQYWGIAFTFILLFDLPISGVAYALVWKFPTIAVMWIFVVGTLWWYFLSRGIEGLLDTIIERGHVQHRSAPKSDTRKQA
jgi:hypothetical protein